MAKTRRTQEEIIADKEERNRKAFQKDVQKEQKTELAKISDLLKLAKAEKDPTKKAKLKEEAREKQKAYDSKYKKK